MKEHQIVALLRAADELESYRDYDLASELRAIVAQLAAPAAPEVWCGCGDQIMPGDGARCGTCVAVKTAFPQGERN